MERTKIFLKQNKQLHFSYNVKKHLFDMAKQNKTKQKYLLIIEIDDLKTNRNNS